MNDPEAPSTTPLIGGDESGSGTKIQSTAGCVTVSILMFISSIMLMIPFGPQNNKGAFNHGEKICIILAGSMILFAVVMEAFTIHKTCCTLGSSAGGVLLACFIVVSMAKLDEGYGLIIFGSLLLIVAAMLFLAYHLQLAVCHFTAKETVSGIGGVMKTLASSLFFVAGVVELAQVDRGDDAPYDFTVFRNLMFSGSFFHAVASIVSVVGHFMK